MALLADESTPTVQDMLNCDGGLLDVAQAESIDLEGKLAIARAEVATKLQIFLADYGENPKAVESVVVTEPLRRWITLTAIGLAFRDGHFRHLSDRYKEKWILYERLAEGAREDLMRMGVGRVAVPIRRPTCGTVAVTPGGLSEGSYAVAVSAVGAQGDESEPSDVATVYLNAEGGIRIEAPALQDSSFRWNAYAGRSPEELQRQNSEPIAAGAALSLTSLLGLGRPGAGQEVASYTRETRVIRRG
ncbi:MAG: hypothetical protein JNK48_35030 [Bryobacterales bacterium]|nr:hypothetical protein [Bryobacterales bacterium]